MSVITKITVQKKNSDRYNIFIDSGKGEEYAFSVDQDVLIKYGLRKGKALDDLSLTEIHYHDEIRKTFNLAVQFLARKMRSEFEVKSHLALKDVEEPIIKEVIHKLYQHKFLNDEEYANAFVRTQINTTDKGQETIKQELKEKGISSSFIEESLQQFSFEQQLEKAVQLSNKYIQKNKKDSFLILKQKVEQMLFRKGYSFEIIQNAISASEIEKDDQEELSAIRIQGEKLHRKYSKFTGFEYKQKIKQALFRKGFSFEIIEKFLSEFQVEE